MPCPALDEPPTEIQACAKPYIVGMLLRIRDLQVSLRHHGIYPTYVSEGSQMSATLYLDDRTLPRCAELGVSGQHRRLRRSQSIISVEFLKTKRQSYVVKAQVGCAIAVNNTMVCC